MSEPTRFRSKVAIMTATDWRQFSGALERTWPDARYVLDPTAVHYWRTPRLLVSKSFTRIHRAAALWDNPITMVLDPTWQPAFYRSDSTVGWGYWPPRHPKVWFRGFHGVHRYPYPNCPPCLLLSFIDVYCNPAFPEHFKFASRLYRLFGKFASNKNLQEVHYPTGRAVEYGEDKPLDRLGPWRMVGHDARRWALQSPEHFLEFNPQKMTGLRPVAPENETSSR